MTAMDFEQWLTVLRNRVALDPDAVPCQQIEGMVGSAIGRPHTVIVIGNLPLERVHDGGFDLLLFGSQAVRLGRFLCFLWQGRKGRLDLHGFTSIEAISSFSHATTSGSLSSAFSGMTSF